MDNENVQNINKKINQIFQEKSKQDKRGSRIGKDFFLQPAELKLLLQMGALPRSSVTALAAVMQITKGAVSQTLKKLEAKALILRVEDPTNASRVLLSLNMEGRHLLQKYEDRQRVLEYGFNRYLQRLSSRDARIIDNFLIEYESSLDINSL